MIDNQDFVIYMHTSPSGKSYIGQTNDYNARCKDHKKGNKCRAFSNAIKKYKWDNFTHTILKDNLTVEEANQWEAHYIKELNTLRPNGYNLKSGGMNALYSDESKLKMSISAKARGATKKNYTLTDEHKAKLSTAKIGKTSWNKGKTHSEEHKLKLSNARKKRVITEETKIKMRASLTGMKRTPAQIVNMKAGQAKRWGKDNGCSV